MTGQTEAASRHPVDRATTLPKALYRAEQVRALDRCAIDEFGISGFELMLRAGRAFYRHTLRRWPHLQVMTVVCGGGNNGGDGYVIAGLAAERGQSVRCIAVTDPASLTGDAARALAWAHERGVRPQPWSGQVLAGDIVVDALLGTGLSGEVREPYRQVIAAMNAADCPVASADLPSGLCSDTGRVLGEAVNAELTVTFIGVKQGLLTGDGPNKSGCVVFDGLGVPPEVYERVPSSCQRVDLMQLRSWMPLRSRTAHKGDCGRVLVVGGDYGMAGAVIMAAEAAARSGAGLVYVATRADMAPAIASRRPELLVHGIESRDMLDRLLATADVLVVGPGLGRTPWSEQMLHRCLDWQGAKVLDADALNLLAERQAPQLDSLTVITPHPGEAARLLRCSVAEVQADRFAALAKLQKKLGCTVLLKGAGSLIGHGSDVPSLANVGNPGMASGGMGDVLSGIIGSLIGQGVSPERAAVLGAVLHGEAADLAACDTGFMGLLAGDVVDALPRVLKQVERVGAR